MDVELQQPFKALALGEPASTKSRLESLPAELRNRIYRETFDNGATVTVTTTKFPEPALLSVSKRIRKEASSIFYSEHTFEVDYSNFSTDARVIFQKKRRAIKHRHGIKMKHENHVASARAFWRNILINLRRVHAGHIKPSSKQTDTDAPVQLDVHYAMMATAHDLQDIAWPRVQPILERYHKILIRMDSAWADEDSDTSDYSDEHSDSST